MLKESVCEVFLVNCVSTVLWLMQLTTYPHILVKEGWILCWQEGPKSWKKGRDYALYLSRAGPRLSVGPCLLLLQHRPVGVAVTLLSMVGPKVHIGAAYRCFKLSGGDLMVTLTSVGCHGRTPIVLMGTVSGCFVTHGVHFYTQLLCR